MGGLSKSFSLRRGGRWQKVLDAKPVSHDAFHWHVGKGALWSDVGGWVGGWVGEMRRQTRPLYIYTNGWERRHPPTHPDPPRSGGPGAGGPQQSLYPPPAPLTSWPNPVQQSRGNAWFCRGLRPPPADGVCSPVGESGWVGGWVGGRRKKKEGREREGGAFIKKF